jgi:4-hydroxy-tetrahydrodipicolinate reductase
MTRVLLAGITGWTGSALAPAIAAADDLTLAGGVSRSAAGSRLHGAEVFADVPSALEATEADVLVDYTSAAAVRAHVDAAIARRVAVVVGSSGLTAADDAQIDAAARAAGVGVIAAGNFSLLAAVLLHAATLAAERVERWEVLDYASADKPDAPSGTARELAARLAEVHSPRPATHDADLIGPPEARGAQIAGTRVHSLRLPGYVVSTQAILASDDERLSLLHEAGASPAPYIEGTLLAIRRVGRVEGLVRGLDRLLYGG